MRRIILFLLVCLSLHAKEQIVDIKVFYEKIEPQKVNDIINLSSYDKYYKAGIEYLSKEEKMHKAEVNKYYKKTEKKIYIPRYDKALEEFEKSVVYNKNPLSAYLGLKCLNFLPTVTSASKIEQTKRRVLFAKLLYNATKMCKAFIDYADILMHGKGVARDYKLALGILSQARQQCWARADDFEKSIIKVKEAQLQFKIKKEQKNAKQ